MTRPTGIFVSPGWVFAFLSCWCSANSLAGQIPVHGYDQHASLIQWTEHPGRRGAAGMDSGFAYRLPYGSSGMVFGSARLDEVYGPGSQVGAPFVLAEIGRPDTVHVSRWLVSNGGAAAGFTVGYAWRNMTLENTTVSTREIPVAVPGARRESFFLTSNVARLSFNPSPRWTVQLSRGSASGLDQFVAGEQVRRTAFSATHKLNLSEGDLQTTIAWGRSSRKDREAIFGYLLESTYRFSGRNGIFGRIEQVGSDEITRKNDTLQPHIFKLNRLTVGYFHEVRASDSFGFDVGAFANRHLVPSSMTASYGDNPTTYMMFVRLRLK